METMPVKEGKVDEKWLDAVLRENALRASSHLPLTEEFGAVCVRFTDAVIYDNEYGFKSFDKLTLAEACSRVYAHLCARVVKYRPESCRAPSNWIYTVAKHRLIQALEEIVSTGEISDTISAIVGSEIIASINGIDPNSPLKDYMSQKMDALHDMKFNKKMRERIFKQTWRESWYRRDGLNIVQRARRHRNLQAARVAVQSFVPSGAVRDGLVKLLEDRKNGRN